MDFLQVIRYVQRYGINSYYMEVLFMYIESEREREKEKEREREREREHIFVDILQQGELRHP